MERLDRQQMTVFEIVDDDHFSARIRKATYYKEADRLAWVALYLSDNGMCQDGHEIDDRRETNVGKNTGYVTFRGHCV